MNKYEVLGIVGEGAYGVVLRCRNKETSETIAIKKFKESEDDDVVRKTTLREVKILRQLRHPCIVSLQEAFRRKGKLYLVFEYVERNLLELLEAHPGGLGQQQVQTFIFQLCMAIDWCHSHRVIHRDIKPENLLVDAAAGTLKLCDFGFARTLPSKTSSRSKALTDYVATRWYRAPELLLGSTDYTTAVDIWAIGCIMGELADGQPLFPGDSDADQLHVIQRGIGPMTSAQMERFLKAKRFRGVKFPDISRSASLAEKYGAILPPTGVDFMRDCLRMDPARRLTARQAVLHPFFSGLPEAFGWEPEGKDSPDGYEDEWEESKSPAMMPAQPLHASPAQPRRIIPLQASGPDPANRTPSKLGMYGAAARAGGGGGGGDVSGHTSSRASRTRGSRRRRQGSRPATRATPHRSSKGAERHSSRGTGAGAAYGTGAASSMYRPGTRGDGDTSRRQRVPNARHALPGPVHVAGRVPGRGREQRHVAAPTRSGLGQPTHRPGQQLGSSATAVAQARADAAGSRSSGVQLPGGPLADIPSFHQRSAAAGARLQPLGSVPEAQIPEQSFRKSQFYVAPLPGFGAAAHHK